jgi:hypothetical protein
MAKLRESRKWTAAESAWVAEHGSERLRRCVSEGIPAAAVYREERLAHEAPGWRYLREGERLGYAMNPPIEAFKFLDRCRLVGGLPGIKLAYIEREDVEAGVIEAAYVCVGDREGRPIVWREELPRPEATRPGKE